MSKFVNLVKDYHVEHTSNGKPLVFSKGAMAALKAAAEAVIIAAFADVKVVAKHAARNSVNETDMRVLKRLHLQRPSTAPMLATALAEFQVLENKEKLKAKRKRVALKRGTIEGSILSCVRTVYS